MNIPADLRVGDILLYDEPDIVDDVIAIKTGDDVAHIEIYAGLGQSWASRNGIGVNQYPFRAHGLMYIRRPIQPIDIRAVLVWVKPYIGSPYGFGDILASVDIVTKWNGMDCSHFAACLLEAGGAPQFDLDCDKRKIAPRDFKIVLESSIMHPPPKVAQDDASDPQSSVKSS